MCVCVCACVCVCINVCVCVCTGLRACGAYHPQHQVEGQHGGHASEGQALQHAAAGVGPVAALRSAVPPPQGLQEAQHLQVHLPALPHGGWRPGHKQLRVRHQCLWSG